MSGEDTRRSGGSSKVPPEKKSRAVVSVEGTEVADDGTGEPLSVVEHGEQEVVDEERDGGAVTLGELADGAKGVIDDLSTSARRLVDRGRYRKLRISRKGKAVLPDIPLAAVAALEAASMYGAGIARILAVNVGAKFLFDVEVVNEADKYFERGKAAVLDGDLERALEALEKAVRIDDTHAAAFLQLGVLFRLRREPEHARVMLERARQLDENGDIGRRAEEILRALDGSSGG